VEGFVRDEDRLHSDGLGRSRGIWDTGRGDSPSFGDPLVDKRSKHHYTVDGMGEESGLFD